MKARVHVFLFACAVLIALTLASPNATRVFAQQGCARGTGTRAAADAAAASDEANTPTFAGPPAGMQALPTDLFTVEELLQGSEALVGPALFPLQHAAPADRHLDLAPHRRQSAGLGVVGRLQQRIIRAKKSSARTRIRPPRNITRL